MGRPHPLDASAVSQKMLLSNSLRLDSGSEEVVCLVQFGGGPKVPTFGSNPPVDNDKGGPRIPNYAPGQNLGKNSIVEKALTDNSPAKQYMKR